MEITREQYSRAYEKLVRRTERVRRQGKTVYNVLRLCGLLFVIGAAVVFFNAVIGFVISALSVAVFLVLFYLEKNFENRFMLSANHYIADKNMMKVYSGISENCFSEESMSVINDALTNESDIRRMGELRRVLANIRLLSGDFDGAFRAIFKDEELFAADKYYELVYYNLVLNYYVNINSTTGGTEYAEEAYRSFEKLFDEFDPAKNDFLALSLALSCEVLTAYSRQDYQRCLEYIDIIIVSYTKGDEKYLAADNSVNRYLAAYYMLLKAECLLVTGKRSEAEEVCRKALDGLEAAQYLREKAEKLLDEITENN